jgi:hypothetical protein
MHTAFKLELDKIDSLQYPSFTTNEIDFWLNQAIHRFVKTRYSGYNTKREGFEETQKRTDDLRTLIREVTVSCTVTGATKPNGYVIVDGFSNAQFSGDAYWLSLGEEVLITPTDGSISASRQGVTEITANDYRFEIDNPYSSFRLHYGVAKPLRLFYNNTIEFISDGTYEVTSAYIRYIKEPVTLVYNSANCDLAGHTHDEVVSLAVQLALENIEQPRLQTYSQEVSSME